jgi:hypothetical protein
MNNFKPVLILSVLGLLAIAIVGCGDDHHNNTTSSAQDVVVASIYPADGATGVLPSSTVSVKFTGAVDTMSVMNNFHFAGGSPMQMWQDSVDHYGGFGMMNMTHRNRMMNWIDSIHMAGQFHWNDAHDSCEFVPGNPTESDTDYLCLIFEGGMQSRDGRMMGGMNHSDSGYHMYQFSTGNGPTDPQ